MKYSEDELKFDCLEQNTTVYQRIVFHQMNNNIFRSYSDDKSAPMSCPSHHIVGYFPITPKTPNQSNMKCQLNKFTQLL